MKRTILIGLILLALGLGACNRSADTVNSRTEEPKKQPAPSAHSITHKDEREMLKQTRENILIIMDVKDETAPLEKALSAGALEQMSAQIVQEKAAGRIKIRRYKGIKLDIQNVTKDIIGLALRFTDQSYTVDGAGQTVEEPTGKRVKLLLAVKKIRKRWRIVEIFSKELTPKGKGGATR